MKVSPPWTAILLLTLIPTALYGQAAEEKTNVSLAAAQVMPGNPAYVTVMLTNVPSVDVTELRHWIEFSKSKLSFVGARLSIAGDLAEATLKFEVQDKPISEQATPEPQPKTEAGEAEKKSPEVEATPGRSQDDTKKTEETTAAVAGQPDGQQPEAKGTDAGIGIIQLSIVGKRPIPDGPVFEISFNVPSELHEQTVVLVHKAEAISPSGEKMAELAFQDGEIVVSSVPTEKPPAIFSCFFYMH